MPAEPDIAKPSHVIPLTDQICFALYTANHAMNRLYKPMLDALGLTYPQYLALNALWAEDQQTVGQLGQQLMLESNTLTPLLKRMEAAGLIRRTRATGDERQVIVSLTDRGADLRLHSAHVPACIFAATGLPVAELVTLQRQVMDLRDNVLCAAQQKGEDR